MERVPEILLIFLILHGVLGGFDVLYNHELVEHLPSRLSAFAEEWLHGARELLFAALFFSMAWWQWQGAWVWLIVAVMALEQIITLSDLMLENKTRHLKMTEHVMHIFLLINYGIFGTLLAITLLQWHDLPSAVLPVAYGWQSWALSLLALCALAWSVRDTLSARYLTRQWRSGHGMGLRMQFRQR